jgi:hypothetical protein
MRRLHLGAPIRATGCLLSSWPSRLLARPSAVRREFYTEFVGTDDATLRAQWSKLLFTGKRSLPKEFTSGADVVAAVAADPNTIGYVDRSFVNMRVKIIYTVK